VSNQWLWFLSQILKLFVRALAATVVRGNPSVPVLRRSEYPPPVLLKYAGVKTWSTFDRDASLWAVGEDGGGFVIISYKKLPTGESVEDQNDKIEFPPGSSADMVIERIIAILQQAPQKCRVAKRNSAREC
jgi:hypothetical protein